MEIPNVLLKVGFKPIWPILVSALYHYAIKFRIFAPSFSHHHFDPKYGHKKLHRGLFLNRGPDLESWDRAGSENIMIVSEHALSDPVLFKKREIWPKNVFIAFTTHLVCAHRWNVCGKFFGVDVNFL